MQLTDFRKPPRRGAYDHLLPIGIEATQPPPQPPRYEPGQVRIEIEIIQRKGRPEPRVGFWSTFCWAVVIILAIAFLAAHAHAQPSSWTTQRFGNGTMSNGTDSQGGQWRGTTQPFGNGSITNFTGPNGQMQTCTSSRFGNGYRTDCR